MIGGLLEKLFVAVGADLTEFKTEMAGAATAASKATADIAKSVDAVGATSATAFEKVTGFAKSAASSIGPILGEGLEKGLKAGIGRAVEVGSEKGIWEGVVAGAGAAFEAGLSEVLEGVAIQIIPQMLASSGAVAAFGTALTGLKASLLSTIPIVGAVGKAFLGLMIGPLGLIVLAVGAVVAAWYYWDEITAIVKRVGEAISEWWSANLKPTFDLVMGVIKEVAGVFKDYFAAQIKAAIDLITAILNGDFKGAWAAMQSFVGNAIKAVLGIIAAFAPNAIQYLAQLYQGAKTWLIDKLGSVFNSMREMISNATGYFRGMWDAVVGHSYIPDMVDGIGAHIARLDGVMVRPIQIATEKGKEAFADLQKETASLLDQLFPDQKKFRDIEQDLGKLWEAFSKDIISPEVFAEAKQRLEAEMADLAKSAAKARDDAIGIAANDNGPIISPETQQEWRGDLARMRGQFDDEFKEPLLKGIERVSVGVADMATNFAGAMDGLVRSIKDRDIVGVIGGVVDVILAVVDAIGAIKGGFKTPSTSTPALQPRATGGTTGTGGLFKVGESGPEILRLGPGGRVYNKSDTQAMLSGGSGGGGSVKVDLAVSESKYFDSHVISITRPQMAQAAQAGAIGGNQMTIKESRRNASRRRPG